MKKTGKQKFSRDKKITALMEENNNLIKNVSLKKKYIKFLAQIEKLKVNLSKVNSMINITSDTEIQSKLEKYFNIFFHHVEEFESEIKDEKVINNSKFFFRFLTKKYLFQSKFLKYSFLKPRGYPGDYEIIEKMYNQKPISSKLGFYLDNYFAKTDYVQAVRDRKNKMKIILCKFINNFPKDLTCIRILNLACGSCREIRELVSESFLTNRQIIFTLVDQEVDALKFASKKLCKPPTNFKFAFIKSDILQFFRNLVGSKEIPKQDLIYSIGLADYLPNSVLIPMVRHSYNLLTKNGCFVIAHKNICEYPSLVSDWSANWKFIPRTKDDLKNLIMTALGDKDYKINFIMEKSKHIFFFILTAYDKK